MDSARRKSRAAIVGAIDDHGIALEVIIDAGNQQLRKEDRAASVDSHARIRGKGPARSLLINKGLIGARPARAAVSRKIGALRIAKYLIRTGGQNFRIRRINSDEGFALRSTLVRDIDIAARACGSRGQRTRIATIIANEFVLAPPRRIV